MRSFFESAATAGAICSFILCTVLFCLAAKDLFDHGSLTRHGGEATSAWFTVSTLVFLTGAWAGSLIGLARSL